MTNQKGFTLIELMIAVVIVAILASVAIASYSSQIEKSRRTTATNALLTIAAEQEKRFFQFNLYNNDIAVLNGGTNESPDGGYYTLAVNVTTAGGQSCDANTCYTLTATAQGAQLSDEQCRIFTLDSKGIKTASNANNANTTDICW